MSNRRETIRSGRKEEIPVFDPTRRQILKDLGLGALGLVASGITNSPGIRFFLNKQGELNGEAKDQHQRCDSASINQVRMGIIKPQEYLQMQNCLPEVAKAEKIGLLKGLLYQPSDQELETILRELFLPRSDDEQSLQSLVTSSMDSYKGATGEDVAVMVPGIIGIFGQKVPVYIVFTEELFASASVRNDADVKSILVKHELQHVKDFYHGITLGNIHLSYDTISPKTLRIEFLRELMELRATYAELEAVFKERAGTGNASVSPEWFASVASNYSNFFTYIKENAATDLEMQVGHFQLQEFRGITPKATNGDILLKFDLFGKQDTAAFKGP